MKVTLRRLAYLKYLYHKLIEKNYALESKIIKLLNSISLADFWTRILQMGSEQIADELIQKTNYESMNSNTYKDIIKVCENHFYAEKNQDPDFFESIKNDIYMLTEQILPQDSGLCRFLKGKSVDRPDIYDAWQFFCFGFWVLIKRYAYVENKEYNINGNIHLQELDEGLKRKIKGSIDTEYIDNIGFLHSYIQEHKIYFNSPYAIFAESTTGEDISNISDHEINVWFYTELDDQNYEEIQNKYYSGNYNEGIRSYFNNSIELYRRVYKEQRKKLGDLFFYFNTPCIDDITKEEIIEELSTYPFNNKIQRWYDRARKLGNHYKDIYFHKSTRNLLTSLKKEIAWGEMKKCDNTCFGIAISPSKTLALYTLLLDSYIDKGNHIDYEQNIVDFAHMLTGLPFTKNRQYSPINWIHKEKQSLAFFIGVMNNYTRKSRGKSLSWPEASKLFKYKGNNISIGSTQFNQARKTEKFEKFEDQINNILELKKLN